MGIAATDRTGTIEFIGLMIQIISEKTAHSPEASTILTQFWGMKIKEEIRKELARHIAEKFEVALKLQQTTPVKTPLTFEQKADVFIRAAMRSR